MATKQFDREQQRAINAKDGYFLVLAPPGCGKTDILSERIAVAKEAGVDFGNMLCLTFTNRASRGMRNRVKERIGDSARDIFIGNVHRYCSNFLYSNSVIPENTGILDEEDMADILMDMGQDYFLNRKRTPDREKIRAVDNLVSYINQRELNQPQEAFFLPSEEYEPLYEIAQNANFDPAKVPSIHATVQFALQFMKYKEENAVISFSDILILAYERLRNDREKEYKRFPWIQIDEVQDLNSLQMAIVDELTEKSGRFTVMYLGDEQQAIFSFLGAKLSQLDFLKNRCSGHILTLGTNYRSPKYLLDIFNTYAEKELDVSPMLLPKTSVDFTPDKYDLILTGNKTPEDERGRILRMVKYYLQFDDERLAILVATNGAADNISNSLTQAGISNFKISGTDMFKSKSYKTLSSLFCVLANEFNAQSWARLLYGIGALSTQIRARLFLRRLKELMMTPSDMISGQSYLERFYNEYQAKEFVFFDTETTGLNVLEDDIVQIAAFKVANGEKVAGSDFNILLHTDREIPSMLGDKVNPLIDEYANNPHYGREEGLRLFLDYIGDDPVLGHNVNYDYHILQCNVERELKEQIQLDVYDSLFMIKAVEPALRMYKLEFLLKELHLEGKNSHLANEDIEATKSLVDYCISKSMPFFSKQQAFLQDVKVVNIAKKLSLLEPLITNFKEHIYQPIKVIGHTIAYELKLVHDEMVSYKYIEPLGPKFDIFLEYVQNEWVDVEVEHTIYDEISAHMNDMTSSINEGDLVNSTEIVKDRVFIMTVHKGKGLEFENVVVLGANDGTYPFFMVNKVLSSPDNYTNKEIAEAKLNRKEDARKFYVALSRAKKRLCVSYTNYTEDGYPTRCTPFMDSIKDFFTIGNSSK